MTIKQKFGNFIEISLLLSDSSSLWSSSSVTKRFLICILHFTLESNIFFFMMISLSRISTTKYVPKKENINLFYKNVISKNFTQTPFRSFELKTIRNYHVGMKNALQLRYKVSSILWISNNLDSFDASHTKLLHN
jgi:hypothetical protein